MRNKWTFLALFWVSIGLTACDEEVSSNTSAPTSSFADLCEASGGTYKDEHTCICNNEDCSADDVCNHVTQKCPAKSPECLHPTDGATCNFDAACQDSGGTPAEGICVCGGKPCSNGVICNFTTRAAEQPVCADNVVPQMCSRIAKNAECSVDNQNCVSVCKDQKSVGKRLFCDGSKYIESVCKNDKNEEVSCKDDESCGTCKNYTQLCVNNASGIGEIRMCQYGDYGDRISDCGDVSCRKDVPACGECKNDELKCTEDNDNNAIMWRCVDGKWNRIENKLDPLDPGYACPDACREGTDPQKMGYECDKSQCDKCDPCWGEPMVGAPSNPNPCYDENRCKEVRKAEDTKYPPFRDFEWSKKVDDRRAIKKVVGYNFTDYRPVQDPNERVMAFDIDLTNGKRRVSCNADGTDFGECHNSLQLCINEQYHTMGFIVQCANGALTDYDNNGDGIACKCERLLDNSNANGCCYTRSSCFKSTTATSGPELCTKPNIDDGDNYGYP